MDVTRVIKLIRDTAGLTQREFAAHIGISLVSLSKIETYHSDVSSNVLKLISNKYDLSPEMIKLAGLEPRKDLPDDVMRHFNRTYPHLISDVKELIVERVSSITNHRSTSVEE